MKAAAQLLRSQCSALHDRAVRLSIYISGGVPIVLAMVSANAVLTMASNPDFRWPLHARSPHQRVANAAIDRKRLAGHEGGPRAR